MVKKIFVTEDKKSGFNSALFMADNELIAMRDFANAVKSPGSLLNSNPEDFYLWYIADFDTKSGVITSFESPTCVCSALSYSDKKVEVEDEV